MTCRHGPKVVHPPEGAIIFKCEHSNGYTCNTCKESRCLICGLRWPEKDPWPDPKLVVMREKR